MRSRFALLVFLMAAWPGASRSSRATAAQGGAAPGPGDLTLARALERVLAANPELAAAELEVRAAEARARQAALRPNPEFAAEAENFAALDGSGLVRYNESTVLLSQRFETGGKRRLRVRAAESDLGVAGRALEFDRSELSAATVLAFAEVLAAQERVANQRELRRLAEQAHAIVAERVAAGKVSPVEQTRAAVALASARLEEERLAQSLAAAKDGLAALWGGDGADFDRAQGKFEIPVSPSGLARPCIDLNPGLRLAEAAVEAQRALLALEQAAAKPDVTVSAGFRYLHLEGVPAWTAGVSIPIPVFDKRQGAIAEARIRVEKSLKEKQALEWRLRAGLSQARHEHERALLEARALEQEALPAAREAAAALEEGYRLGKFDYLNVLDAQRTYAELQRQYIEAVASGSRAAAEIERLARCRSLPDAEPSSGRPAMKGDRP
jgi:cobalt-zinc-cadmium efflux system outer membrane protein